MDSLEHRIMDLEVILMDKLDIGALLIIGFLCFLLGTSTGYYLAINEDIEINYKDSAVMTCEYANNLTKLINLQSETLKLCSGFEYTKLDQLNCALLK